MATKKGPKDWTPEFKDVHDARIEQCLTILAPDWFARPDFQRWRRRSGVATWAERDPEGQDVFIVWADHELDWHVKGLPHDILKKLELVAKETELEYGTIWIKAV